MACYPGAAGDYGFEPLMNLPRKNIRDKRVIELIKKYLKAGVMENGLLVKTTEGSPQGGPLSPLLANIYFSLILRSFSTICERGAASICT